MTPTTSTTKTTVDPRLPTTAQQPPTRLIDNPPAKDLSTALANAQRQVNAA